jgi:hypothetical protein
MEVWRVYFADLGETVTYCPECAERDSNAQIELANTGPAAARNVSYWAEDERGSRFSAPSSWPRNVLMPQERVTVAVTLQHPLPEWAEGDVALVVAWEDALGEHQQRFGPLPQGPAEF